MDDFEHVSCEVRASAVFIIVIAMSTSVLTKFSKRVSTTLT